MQALHVPVVLLLAHEELVVEHLGVDSFDLVQQLGRYTVEVRDVRVRVVDVIVKLGDQEHRC